MKALKHISTLLLVFLFSLILVNCEKVDPKMEILEDPYSELNTSALKAAPEEITDEINYLLGLIDEIEALLEDGLINRGNANALIVKIENAIKSLDKGNSNAAENQLGAFTSQVEVFVDNGVIPENVGEELINVAENAIILSEGGFIDPRDGQVYSVVLIGDQIWIAENLRYLPEVSPVSIESTVDPHYYVYGYNGSDLNEAVSSQNYYKYGVLYNWPASISACPDGWHIPSFLEWSELADFISEANGGYDKLGDFYWENVGTHLKSTTGWWQDGNGTDDYGFNGIPGGLRYSDGWFGGEGAFFYFYMSDLWAETAAASVTTWYFTSAFYRQPGSFDYGINIRCVKD